MPSRTDYLGGGCIDTVQLTIKKGILDIKLGDRPMANRSHNKKSVNSGHMSHERKCLIVIADKLLLTTTCHKTVLETIRVSLNLVGSHVSDRTNTGRKRNKIPHDGAQEKQAPLPSHVAIRDEQRRRSKKTAQEELC
jgi:hypothetical protein